jgi:hypothetical protein
MTKIGQWSLKVQHVIKTNTMFLSTAHCILEIYKSEHMALLKTKAKIAQDSK